MGRSIISDILNGSNARSPDNVCQPGQTPGQCLSARTLPFICTEQLTDFIFKRCQCALVSIGDKARLLSTLLLFTALRGGGLV